MIDLTAYCHECELHHDATNADVRELLGGGEWRCSKEGCAGHIVLEVGDGWESPAGGVVALLLAAARLSLEETKQGRHLFIGAAGIAHGFVVQERDQRSTPTSNLEELIQAAGGELPEEDSDEVVDILLRAHRIKKALGGVELACVGHLDDGTVVFMAPGLQLLGVRLLTGRTD